VLWKEEASCFAIAPAFQLCSCLLQHCLDQSELIWRGQKRKKPRAYLLQCLLSAPHDFHNRNSIKAHVPVNTASAFW